MRFNPILRTNPRFRPDTIVSALTSHFRGLTETFRTRLLHVRELKCHAELSRHLRQDIGLEAVQPVNGSFGAASEGANHLFNHAVRMEMMRKF